jgi:predicted nuclease of predicted toxin-antitoxin system
MKMLLDENLPKRLKRDFSEHEVYTIHEKSWNGMKNGELLQLMLGENFNVLLTFDKNLQYQQNFLKYPIAVFVLNAPINTYQILTNLSDEIKKILSADSLPVGVTVISIDS